MPVTELVGSQRILNKVDEWKTPMWNCWRLETHKGQQVWKFELPESLKSIVLTPEDWNKPEAQQFLKEMRKAFEYDKSVQAHSADLPYRIQALKSKKFAPNSSTGEGSHLNEQAWNSAIKGFHFYKALQTGDGNWPGDYGGPMFLLPGMVIVAHLTANPIPQPHSALCVQYMYNMQNTDGGWGLHFEGESTMLGTVLQYVSLRLLGEKPTEPAIEKARNWIHQNGGANFIPSWGKFYLSVLGVYEWKGFSSILPELWTFPKSLPIHPSKYWCHARMVHLPMAYCYANKIVGEISPLINELREELYTTPYEKVNWKKARRQFYEKDIYTPHSVYLKVASRLMNLYEPFHFKKWRKRASEYILGQMVRENENTNHINLGPVNHVMNALCLHHAYGSNDDRFKKSVSRWFDYLWLAEDGMKMNGYNGSQFWDTNFAALALLENRMDKMYPEVADKIYQWLDDQQIKEETPDRLKYDRCIRKGGWAFSTVDQGWPITDCSAEGLKTAIKYMNLGLVENETATINRERLQDTVDLLLAYQNKNGGWASYEPTRAPQWVEKLNAAEVFGDIMLDYSYAECTSACLQGLTTFRNKFPDYKKQEVDASIERGKDFLKSIQREDGSWMGSWAVCFTYATWFEIEGLLAAGENDCTTAKTHNAITKACNFLLSIQKPDGGWGEHFESCVQKKYIPHTQSQVTNTAWALLALMAAKNPNKVAIEKGIRFLMGRQDEWGDFPQEQISGVFNFNCMITYTSYRNVFPIWALSRFAKGQN